MNSSWRGRASASYVRCAFYVSASAIGLAMLFTWIEKTSVTARYGQVEKIRELGEGFFKGGAGGESIGRRVESGGQRFNRPRTTWISPPRYCPIAGCQIRDAKRLGGLAGQSSGPGDGRGRSVVAPDVGPRHGPRDAYA